MKEGKLEPFFNPKSIAIIGASNKQGKIGNILMKKLRKYKGKVIPVNINRPIIFRKTSYAKISDYKKQIDLVVIATPAKTVPKLLEECGKNKIKNIIIISAGFREKGYNKRENNIIKIKEKYDLNILGPNCFGIINPSKNLDLTFSKLTPKRGSTAFISQSGALGSYIIDHGIKLSGFASLGNISDIDFADFIEYFNKDRKTKKIIVYMEALKKGRKFIDACKKSKKEIIIVKSGKTKKGKQATQLHTGSLATENEIYSGAFIQAKVKEAPSLAKAFGLKQDKILYTLKGKKLVILTNAGGAGALLTDQIANEGHTIIGPKDLLGTATSLQYKTALHKLTGDYKTIILVATPQIMTDFEEITKVILNSRWKDKIVACLLGNESVKKAKEILKKNMVTVLTKAV